MSKSRPKTKSKSRKNAAAPSRPRSFSPKARAEGIIKSLRRAFGVKWSMWSWTPRKGVGRAKSIHNYGKLLDAQDFIDAWAEFRNAGAFERFMVPPKEWAATLRLGFRDIEYVPTDEEDDDGERIYERLVGEPQWRSVSSLDTDPLRLLDLVVEGTNAVINEYMKGGAVDTSGEDFEIERGVRLIGFDVYVKRWDVPKGEGKKWGKKPAKKKAAKKPPAKKPPAKKPPAKKPPAKKK